MRILVVLGLLVAACSGPSFVVPPPTPLPQGSQATRYEVRCIQVATSPDATETAEQKLSKALSSWGEEGWRLAHAEKVGSITRMMCFERPR